MKPLPVGPAVCPSVLSADFAEMGRDVRTVVEAGCEVIHLDVMDGHFVPNISFGPGFVKDLRPVTDAYFDVHLMISEPLRYAEAFVKAGADGLTFHVEAVESVDDAVAAASHLRQMGVRVGITLKPGTPVQTLEPVLGEVDLVLVMSVEPGFSGQSFMPGMLDKVRWLRPRLTGGQRLQIDGGIDAKTIRQAADAGTDWFVAASAIFGEPDCAAAYRKLAELAAGC
ncbi:MAG: ribulose-phosphate 3-epimerase [Phycisphaerae bacterium]